ncbi:MAG TPA: anthranilate synthase component I [Aggregatilinea sp.]|uniref:anthranilate synthase component I n=1 Tax=Aggregatilinea sp. TaxID=2806333 RepID=UPI002B7E02F6|nr:anthranilate synthase component I [Aggregatilinea sp.]HML21884.1 anthranilate synthase component I [Aggregatilinea sp.]
MAISPNPELTRVRATPDRETARRLFDQGDLVPVYRTLLADLETPVSVYLKLAQGGGPSFLLESVEGGEQIGRYSFMGVRPKGMVTVQDNRVTVTRHGDTSTRDLLPGEDPLHVVEREFERVQPVRIDGLPRFIGGAVGYASYDMVRYFERLPATATDELHLPDAAFMLADTLVIFDHARHQLIVLANAHNTGDPDAAYDDALARIDGIIEALAQPLPFLPDRESSTEADSTLHSNMTREQYEANVRAAKEYIAAGDAFQIVLSQRFSRRTTAEPFTIYRALRALNPSPYMFFLRYDDDLSVIGASPEMMVRLEDGIATARPIAGTRPRGKSEAEDDALEAELLADEKERAEHVMLVDLGRNDLGRVCDYGTVRVPAMMYVERYSHVMHIVSQVQGQIRQGMSAFDLLRATFPAGTLSGAPKVRAMEIIEELEGTRRGPYGGAVGYFSFDGSMDTCITIRTMVMQGDTVYFQSGAGIVADSDPAREYDETVNKARAVAVAVTNAEDGLA